MIYGPSTVGMFNEFFVQGEVTANQPLRHQRTGQDTTEREVTGDDYVRRIQPSMKGAEAAPSATAPLLSSAERVRCWSPASKRPSFAWLNSRAITAVSFKN